MEMAGKLTESYHSFHASCMSPSQEEIDGLNPPAAQN